MPLGTLGPAWVLSPRGHRLLWRRRLGSNLRAQAVSLMDSQNTPIALWCNGQQLAADQEILSFAQAARANLAYIPSNAVHGIVEAVLLSKNVTKRSDGL